MDLHPTICLHQRTCECVPPCLQYLEQRQRNIEMQHANEKHQMSIKRPLSNDLSCLLLLQANAGLTKRSISQSVNVLQAFERKNMKTQCKWTVPLCLSGLRISSGLPGEVACHHTKNGWFLAQNLFHSNSKQLKTRSQPEQNVYFVLSEWKNGSCSGTNHSSCFRFSCFHIQGSPFPLQVVSFQALCKSLSH